MQIAVEVLPSSTRRALARIEAVAEGATDRMEAIIEDEIFSFAIPAIQAQWPIDTGLSRAAFTAMRIGPLNWLITNPVTYSGYVHPKGQKTPLRKTLIPDVVARTQTRISERIRAMLAEIRRSTGVSIPGGASSSSPSGGSGLLDRVRSLFSGFFG